MKITHTRDTMSNLYLNAVRIRHQVFMREQGVPKELEIDQDEAACIHFVLYVADEPVATCRLLPLTKQTVKLQRMAVLAPFRGQNYGRELLIAAQKTAAELHYQEMQLHAQVTALGFYENLGFTRFGEKFLDANIAHYHMQKVLN